MRPEMIGKPLISWPRPLIVAMRSLPPPSALPHHLLQCTVVSSTAKGKSKGKLKEGQVLKRSIIPKKKPSGSGCAHNENIERLTRIVESCLNAPTPVCYLTPKQRWCKAEREKLGLIRKKRQCEIGMAKAKAKAKGKGNDEEKPVTMGTLGLDLIMLGLVDTEKVPKYELMAEDSWGLVKEYSRVLMRKHRVRQAAKTTLPHSPLKRRLFLLCRSPSGWLRSCRTSRPSRLTGSWPPLPRRLRGTSRRSGRLLGSILLRRSCGENVNPLEDRFLAFSPEQHPIVLQIGGSNLVNLAKATELANAYRYDEINLNCGCPSGKVAGHGCFGARLMFDPKFVADAMSAIAANCDVPVSVKCRIGIDDRDSYNELCEFVNTVASHSPTRHFIIHARKALLNGISPAANRSIPPLRYEYYFSLLRDFPELQFTLNGGITSINQVDAARKQGAHRVMLGRAAYNNPWSTLGFVDAAVYDVPSAGFSRRQILEQFQVYGDSVVGKDGPNKPNIRQLIKPLLHLFHSEPGNSLWKRKADAALRHCTTIKSFLEETMVAIPDHVLDATPCNSKSSLCGDFVNTECLLPPPYKSSEMYSVFPEDDVNISASLCTSI